MSDNKDIFTIGYHLWLTSHNVADFHVFPNRASAVSFILLRMATDGILEKRIRDRHFDALGMLYRRHHGNELLLVKWMKQKNNNKQFSYLLEPILPYNWLELHPGCEVAPDWDLTSAQHEANQHICTQIELHEVCIEIQLKQRQAKRIKKE